MTEFLTVSDIAKEQEQELGVEISPKMLSDLFYQRKLDVRTCPVIGGRRLVPRGLMPTVLQALRDRGLVIPGPKND